MLDADRDLQHGWRKIKQELSRAKVQLPAEPDPTGTIVPEQRPLPQVGIWLMPDNSSQGELEDFALRMVPSKDPVWPLSRCYLESIPEDKQKFAPEKTDKAQLYAWLATRKEPGRMGAAVGAGDLETCGTLCQDFLKWLDRLFG